MLTGIALTRAMVVTFAITVKAAVTTVVWIVASPMRCRTSALLRYSWPGLVRGASSVLPAEAMPESWRPSEGSVAGTSAEDGGRGRADRVGRMLVSVRRPLQVFARRGWYGRADGAWTRCAPRSGCELSCSGDIDHESKLSCAMAMRCLPPYLSGRFSLNSDLEGVWVR